MSTGKRKGKKKNKKIVDPFTKKDWYDIRAPAIFTKRDIGKTLVNRTQGTRIASDYLKGRVVHVNLADLMENEEYSHNKFSLRVEEVQGKHLLTNFHGMCFTTDKVKSMVRKWQTLIEAVVSAKTTDGYYLRLFCIAFTKKRPNQVKKTAYAQKSQERQIRGKMRSIMKREVQKCELKDLINKLRLNSIGESISKSCRGIYPITNVYVRKVKLLRAPRYDPHKLLELHGEGPKKGSKSKK